jgi:hypothetical protein
MQKDSSVCLLPRSVSRHKNDVLVRYTSDKPRPFPLLPRRSRPFEEVKNFSGASSQGKGTFVQGKRARMTPEVQLASLSFREDVLGNRLASIAHLVAAGAAAGQRRTARPRLSRRRCHLNAACPAVPWLPCRRACGPGFEVARCFCPWSDGSVLSSLRQPVFAVHHPSAASSLGRA